MRPQQRSNSFRQREGADSAVSLELFWNDLGGWRPEIRLSVIDPALARGWQSFKAGTNVACARLDVMALRELRDEADRALAVIEGAT